MTPRDTYFEPLQRYLFQWPETHVPEKHEAEVGKVAVVFDGELPHGEHGDEVHHGEVVLEGVALQEAEDEHREQELLLVHVEGEQEEVQGY